MGERSTSKTILLVEDDAVMRRIVHRWLIREGFVVIAVGGGAAALEVALEADAPADAGVFDIDLPDINGVEVARRLLELGRVRRAVFFTGTIDETEQARARAHGRVVDKIDGVQALLAALRHCLEEEA